MALVLQLARHLQVDRPGAGDRRRRDRRRRADPGAGRRVAARHARSSGRRSRGKKEPKGARFAAIGDSPGPPPGRVRRSPPGGVLAVLAIFALGFNPNFDLGDSGAPKNVESAVALKTLQKGLPAGRHRPDRGAAALRPTARRSTEAELTAYAAGAGQGRRRRPGRARPPLSADKTDRVVQRRASTRTRRPTRRWPTSRARSATPRTRPHRRAPRRWSAARRRSSRTSRRR